MRYGFAVFVVGVALVGSWTIYDNTRETRSCVNVNYATGRCRGVFNVKPRPGWAIPAALMIIVVGVAGGVGIATTRTRVT